MKLILILVLALLLVWFVVSTFGQANRNVERWSKDLEAKKKAKIESSHQRAQARIDNYDRIKAAGDSDDDKPVL